MRLSVVVVAACLSIIGLSHADDAGAALRKTTNIPAQHLSTALQVLAKERDFQIVYVSEEVNSLRTEGAVGEFNTEEVLKQLLKGTGMTYRYLDEKTITILPAARLPGGAAGTHTAPMGQAMGASSSNGFSDNSTSTALRQLVAQASPAERSSSNQAQGNPPASTQQQSPILEEVIVTAQKRKERLQDVPVPVTSLDAESLATTGQLRLQDYFSSVPGLDFTTQGYRSAPVLAIRGITTGNAATNPTVGIVVDDVPYGSTTGAGGGTLAVDIDPSDLERIEVLRGPQGTLYGANSMGGLLKYVTAEPSVEAASGRLEIGGASIRNGNETGYSARGAVNLPFGETWAVRASMFSRLDPGYIDDPVLNQKGVNKAEAYGGRLSTLWKPSTDFSLKLSALIQKDNPDGWNLVTPSLGDLKQVDARGTGWTHLGTQAYAATIAAKLGPGDLASVSGYNINKYSGNIDLSAFFGAPFATLEDNKTDRFTQEVRYSVPFGKQVDWLLGGFYSHESTQYVSDVYSLDQSGSPVTLLADTSGPIIYKEYAAFTDLTFRVTDQFDVQVGGRESEIRETAETLSKGQVVVPSADIRANAFTYLFTPRLKLTPDAMLYARLASGYRPGGSNGAAALNGLPPQFQPDKTENYEIGAKGDFLERRLSLDASLYYIKWHDIQLLLIDQTGPFAGTGYYANGAGAKSQGLELSMESRPVGGLSMTAWVAWDDAVLTEAFPPSSGAYGNSGDRLPYSSRFSGNFTINYESNLAANFTAFAGVAVAYVGDRIGEFTGTGSVSAQRQELPGYGRLNLSGGAKFGTWRATLFANNVTDRRGVVDGGLGTVFPTAFSYIPPRTVGLTLAKAWP